MTTASRALLFTIIAVTAACLDPDEASLSESEHAVQLPQYTVVSNTVTSTSASTFAQAMCPAGTHVLGGSFAATNASGVYLRSVVPIASAPTAGNRSWLVQARNTRRGSWNLRVSAICATQPTDYLAVNGGTAYSTSSHKQHSIACPAGTRITGAGFALLDEDYAILPGEATYFMPSWDGTSWLANAKTSATVPSALHLWAVCVDADLPGYEVVTNESTYNAQSPKQLITACPGTKAMTGAGWGVVDNTYAILDGSSLIHEVDNAGQTWLTNATNNSAFSPSWRLQQRALCVD